MNLFEQTLAHDDPFEFVYECISGTNGEEAMNVMVEMYNQIAIDYNYHPDDDFEEIIVRMIDLMEDM